MLMFVVMSVPYTILCLKWQLVGRHMGYQPLFEGVVA